MVKRAEKRIAADITGKKKSFIFNSFGSNKGWPDLASALIKIKKEIKEIIKRDNNLKLNISHLSR